MRASSSGRRCWSKLSAITLAPYVPKPSRLFIIRRCLVSQGPNVDDQGEKPPPTTTIDSWLSRPTQAKAFLFSPTIRYADFAIKFQIIDRYLTTANRHGPSWLGRALTYVAASWRDVCTEQRDQSWPEWMLPVRPETAYFVLDVLLHRASKEDAVKIVEDFSQRYPHVNVYSQRLQVWSSSGLPNAHDKIQEIINEMERKRVRYTRRLYAVLLQHFSDDPLRIQELVQEINKCGMIPDTQMWAALASSYARNDRLNDAIYIWKVRLWESPTSSSNDRHGKMASLLRKAASELTDGLRERITNDRQTTRSSLRHAQSLLTSLKDNGIQMDDSLIYSMMRLYAQARRFQKTRWLYYRLTDQEGTFITLLNSLIRSHVKAKGPAANQLLRQHVVKYTLEPREAILVYFAWTKSIDNTAAGKNAMEIHNLYMKDRADLSIVYFNALLKCLAESPKTKHIKPLVDDIWRRLEENGLEPDETTYTLAVRALLDGGRAADAEKLFQVMLNSKTPPNIRTINTILVHHANHGELASAIHCELTLNQLNKVADHHGQVHVKPNAVTYNIILQAWAKTDAPFSTNRMWKVYHRMIYRGIEPNMVTYNTLINYFTRTIEIEDVRRAEEILKSLEEHPTLKPTKTHYYRIMKTYMDCEEYHLAELLLDRRIAAYVAGNHKVAPVSANFHHLAAQFMMDGDIVEATEFLKRMVHVCEKYKLPNHPNVRTYRMLYEYWQTEEPSLLRDRYEVGLEEMMMDKFPHVYPRVP